MNLKIFVAQSNSWIKKQADFILPVAMHQHGMKSEEEVAAINAKIRELSDNIQGGFEGRPPDEEGKEESNHSSSAFSYSEDGEGGACSAKGTGLKIFAAQNNSRIQKQDDYILDAMHQHGTQWKWLRNRR